MMFGMGTRAVRIFMHREPTDMRKHFDGLAAIVVRDLKGDVSSGDVFVFVGKTRKRAKALVWDGTGLGLYAKKLVQGHFAAPWADGVSSPTLTLTTTELALFFEGSPMVLKKPMSPPAYDRSRDTLVFR